MQPPPPPMMRRPFMMDRKKTLVIAAIGIGLLFVMIGAILVDASNQIVINETPEAAAARENLRTAWGPAVAHFGMFLFVAGLVAAALLLEEMDIFVRLFMLIVAFVALLMVLANSPTIFGAGP